MLPPGRVLRDLSVNSVQHGYDPGEVDRPWEQSSVFVLHESFERTSSASSTFIHYVSPLWNPEQSKESNNRRPQASFTQKPIQQQKTASPLYSKADSTTGRLVRRLPACEVDRPWGKRIARPELLYVFPDLCEKIVYSVAAHSRHLIVISVKTIGCQLSLILAYDHLLGQINLIAYDINENTGVLFFQEDGMPSVNRGKGFEICDIEYE
jgi:hypothetical protein